MHVTVLPSNPQSTRQRLSFYKALHLFYAGLFAFVLPLICWGAQATPGHPHAHAHFVFMMPPMQASAALAGPVGNSSGHNHTDMDHTAHQATKKPVEQPVGRSVPSMMGAALLLLIGLTSALVPMNPDGPPLCRWLAPPVALSFTPLLATPPPRAVAC